jgi:hypothetical protein
VVVEREGEGVELEYQCSSAVGASPLARILKNTKSSCTPLIPTYNKPAPLSHLAQLILRRIFAMFKPRKGIAEVLHGLL